MESMIRVLEIELERTEMFAAFYEEELRNFQAMRERRLTLPPELPAVENRNFNFKGMKVGAAVLQFMKVRQVATEDEIREGLDKGGVAWEKYPKRQVALAVSNRPDLYARKGNMVILN